jgi:hypothetical protein
MFFRLEKVYRRFKSMLGIYMVHLAGGKLG